MPDISHVIASSVRPVNHLICFIDQFLCTTCSVITIGVVPLTADTSDAPRVLRITINGEWPSFDERATFRRDLVTNGDLKPETRTLVDLRGLTTLPAHGDVDSIVSAARREGGLPRLHAYIVTTVDQIVLARMLKHSAGVGTIVEIFKDLKEAETWLWNAEPDW
jgi:hypothetical protein